MKKITSPAIWLIAMIVGLPLFSENVYSPSLPAIALALQAPDSWVEYTLTIYLLGFAVGTLIWGKLSDQYGRKPTLMTGFTIYIIGAIGCCFSTHIFSLLFWRFIQAFGGSAGSVLGRTITQESFPSAERGRVFSTIATSLAVSPALAPAIGGITSQTFGWAANFYLLAALGLFMILAIFLKLPETLHRERRAKVSITKLATVVIKDKRFLSLSFFIAAVNGIGFSYFAEGPFYLIELLGLSPSTFGMSFLGLALGYMMGAFLSRHLHQYYTSAKILGIGVKWVLLLSTLYPILTLIGMGIDASKFYYITLTLSYIGISSVGMALIIPNGLSLSLESYPNTAGTAASLFGGFYYIGASLLTFGMGWLHNDTLLPMPCYFFFMAFAMWLVYHYIFLETEKAV